jgi:hypothetical protein
MTDDIMVAKEVSIVKSLAGWRHIEDFIKLEEGKLTKKLMTCPSGEVDRARGGLEFIKKLKTFLDMVNLSGSEAIKELETVLNRI